MKKLSMILSLALILCFMVGCQDKEAMTELEEFRAQAEVEEQNIAIYRAVIEGINKRNFDKLKEYFAPDYRLYSPSMSANPRSLEVLLEYSKMFLRAFPDYELGIEDLIVAGDKVIGRYIVRGTHKGEFFGIPATGNKIEHSVIIITRIKDGKIIEEWEEADRLGMVMQLGMELKPMEEK